MRNDSLGALNLLGEDLDTILDALKLLDDNLLVTESIGIIKGGLGPVFFVVTNSSSNSIYPHHISISIMKQLGKLQMQLRFSI